MLVSKICLDYLFNNHEPNYCYQPVIFLPRLGYSIITIRTERKLTRFQNNQVLNNIITVTFTWLQWPPPPQYDRRNSLYAIVPRSPTNFALETTRNTQFMGINPTETPKTDRALMKIFRFYCFCRFIGAAAAVTMTITSSQSCGSDSIGS